MANILNRKKKDPLEQEWNHLVKKELKFAESRKKDMGYFIYTADMDGTDYRKETYPDKKVLIIGNEGNGVSRLVSRASDVILSIPMKGNINSLNASASAAILIYGMIKND